MIVINVTSTFSIMEHEKTIIIHVDSRGHANLDSLPFRYGFYFSTNSTMTLTNCKNWTQSSIQKSNGTEEERFVLDAEFVKPDGTSDYGRFVLANHGFEHMNLVTVFKHDSNTEKNLSDHLTKVRKEGSLTPEDLVELHPYYVSGKARSVAGLIGTIIDIEALKTEHERKQKTAAEAGFDKVVSIAKRHHQEKVIAEEEADIQRQKRELAEQEVDSERLARIEAENLAKQAHERNAALEEQIKSISKSHPQYDGSDIEISRVARLLGAEKRQRTKANGQTIDCVFLSFEGSHPERKMDEVFDPQDLIFNKAKNLIGEMVVTSTWKPEIFRATHWFRDIFLWEGGISSSQPEWTFDTPQKVEEKTYLNCPFAEKDECKALGGKWDPNVKKWYVPGTMDLDKFRKWLPKSAPTPETVDTDDDIPF